jgi:hypothetical protein
VIVGQVHFYRKGVVFYRKIADNATRSIISRQPGHGSITTIIRGLAMKLKYMFWVALALTIPANVFAYGEGGSGTGICQKLNFSDFTPANHSEVAQQSAFSFFATGAIYPNGIKVTVRGQSVPVTVTANKDGYKVTGNLPQIPSGGYAKVNIEARGVNQCEVTGGWLLKVNQ